MNIKHTIMALLAGAVMCACSEAEYEAATLTGDNVYFPTDASGTVAITSGQNSVDVTLCRMVTDSELTVALTYSDESVEGFYTGKPASVTFAAGEAQATLTLTFDYNQVVEDEEYGITVNLGDEVVSPYGIGALSIAVCQYSPWNEVGTGVWADGFWYGDEFDVTIYQNANDESKFRFANPYTDDYVNGWEETTATYTEWITFYVDSESGQVSWDEYIAINTDYYGSGEIKGYLPSALAASIADYDALSYAVTDDAGQMLYFCIAPYWYIDDVGGWGCDYPCYLYFPEYLSNRDTNTYAAAFSYSGCLTDAEGDCYAQGTITLDEAVGSATYTVVPKGTDTDEVIAGLIDGSIEGTTITASGLVNVALGEAGTYYMVVVTYNADGDAKDSSVTKFTYTPSTAEVETWTLVGTGDYTYSDVFVGVWVDEGLELYVSDADPTRYKITHWCYDVDFIFTYDAATGQVTVPENETGYEYGSYGDCYVCEAADYLGVEETSYYADGTFYFCVAYYCSAGRWGYDYETFTLGAAAQTKARRARATNTTGKPRHIKPLRLL